MFSFVRTQMWPSGESQISSREFGDVKCESCSPSTTHRVTNHDTNYMTQSPQWQTSVGSTTTTETVMTTRHYWSILVPRWCLKILYMSTPADTSISAAKVHTPTTITYAPTWNTPSGSAGTQKQCGAQAQLLLWHANTLQSNFWLLGVHCLINHYYVLAVT